jgi:hypothetical protein
MQKPETNKGTLRVYRCPHHRGGKSNMELYPRGQCQLLTCLCRDYMLRDLSSTVSILFIVLVHESLDVCRFLSTLQILAFVGIPGGSIA